jgi:hypothetical protein
LIQKLSTRFDQLAEEINAIDATKQTKNGDFGPYTIVDDERLLSWKVKAKSLLVSSCGNDSQHYQEFIRAEKPGGFESNYDQFKRMRSVFAAAMEDYKGGFLTSIKNLIQADVFDSELEQAKELLVNGYKVAAAVIAGVVLETTLRDLCTREGLSHSKLDKMNADLAKAGIYNKLQQKRITALADIRNGAAHGKSGEFSDDDVNSMIRDVEQFLANQLA